MKKEHLSSLKNIINNYEEFKKIAASLTWVDSEFVCCDASQRFREIALYFFSVKFPNNYLQTNFSNAVVQTMLSVMGEQEEWGYDCWKNMTSDERIESLTRYESFLSDYVCYKRCPMREMTSVEFMTDLRSWIPWAMTKEEECLPYKKLLPESVRAILSEFSQAEVVALGGTDYPFTPDETWIAVQEDAVLFVSFGCSG